MNQAVASTAAKRFDTARPRPLAAIETGYTRTMENTIERIVLLFAALATGGLMVNWIGLARAMSRLSVSAYVEFHQHTNRTFDPYMPIVVIGALAGGVVLAVMNGADSIPGQLAATGAVFYALVIIVGVPTCVRINHQITSWSVSEPATGMVPNPCAMDSVSRHSNIVLRSPVRHLSSRRDVEYQPSIMATIDINAESRRLSPFGGFCCTPLHMQAHLIRYAV